MNQPFNPYQHNVDILRGFFRKPIILITALTFCVPSYPLYSASSI